MPVLADITGQRFGRLTAIEPGERAPWGTLRWICRCDCGRSTLTTVGNLRGGHTTSCGCQRRDSHRQRHEGSKHTHPRLYECWLSMRKRCYATHYHGRRFYTKIEVYPAWKESFIPFRDWALANGYADDLTLERIDNRKHYKPSNCEWITKTEQARRSTLVRLI